MDTKTIYREIAEQIMQKNVDPHCILGKQGCYNAVIDAMEEYAVERFILFNVSGLNAERYAKYRLMCHQEEIQPLGYKDWVKHYYS